jgi:glucosyl-3-phosphoglycerate synthase
MQNYRRFVMGDFLQFGPATTLHRLPGIDLSELEKELTKLSRRQPISLLIPALASEMDAPALGGILKSLKTVGYLDELILVLGRADEGDFQRAQRLLEPVSTRTTIVWPEGPRLSEVLEKVRKDLDVGAPGKGRDVWIALGYLLSRGKVHALGLHDADIIGYTGEIPIRLLFPLIHPELNYSFCKGYYTRVSDGSIHGRVTRLLVAPLVSVLSGENPDPILELIGSMRYPLAGEFAMTAELAGRIPVPRDWGLEVGILSSISRVVSPAKICQADLCDNYEHKHQALSPDDSARGLNRMAVEVSESLLRESCPAEGWMEDLPARYAQKAGEMVPRYRADSLASGLKYDEAAEQKVVETFTGAVRTALSRMQTMQTLPPLPAWEEVEKRVPGLMEAVAEAVEKENQT